MVENEASNVSIIASGPSFEIWKGPYGSMRLDWTKAGSVRWTVQGIGHAAYAVPVIKRWDIALRTGVLIAMFDFWEMSSYEPGFRSGTQVWAAKHRNEIKAVHLITQSKLVSMGASVVNLALSGIINVCAKKADFEVQAQKLGLPVNPSLTVD